MERAAEFPKGALHVANTILTHIQGGVRCILSKWRVLYRTFAF
jgi:hypothetical protein